VQTSETPYFPLTRAAPVAGASTDLGEVGGAERAEPASTDGWGQAYSNSMRHRTSAPKLPSEEEEMSLTLSYDPSTETRGESCHSTLERISRDSATPLVTLARMRSARRLVLPQLAGARPFGAARLRSSPKTVLALRAARGRGRPALPRAVPGVRDGSCSMLSRANGIW
jgi:hypothetical protein